MGRILKKKELPERSDVTLDEYPWPTFSECEMVGTDNPRNSVILAAAHTQHYLVKNIRIPPEFMRQFRVPQKAKTPPDLSEDYSRTQREMALRRRKKSMDEDDEISLELADIMQRDGPVGSWKKRTTDGAQNAGGEVSALETSPTDTSAPDSVDTEAEPVSAPQFVETSLPQPGFSSDVQGGIEQFDEESEVPTTSAAASAESHQESPPVAVSAEEREELRAFARQEGFDDGHRAGYEDGFRAGEERGEAAAQSRWEKRIAGISDIIREIGVKQAEILMHGEELFIEFTKIAAQSVLRAQIGASDDTLRSLFLQVVSPLMEATKITLDVATDDVDRVRRVLSSDPEIKGKITVRENAQLAVGDFRVEADNELIVSDLAASVASVVDELRERLNLESEEEVTMSSEVKVG